MSPLQQSLPQGPELGRIRGVMFDVDGCLVLSANPTGEDGAALPGAAEAVAALTSAGLPFVVFTNASSRLPGAIAQELAHAGIHVREDQVLTPSVVAGRVLAKHHPGGRVLAFGGDGLTVPLAQAGVELIDIDAALETGAENVAAVVIGWDTNFDRAKIQLAAEALQTGAVLYCTSDAPAFASQGRLNVGVSGFITAGLTHVAGVSHEVVGKPSTAAMETIADTLGIDPDEILVVGDDLVLEAGMAREHGAQSVIVTTGMTSRGQAEAAPDALSPDWVVDSMHEFVSLIRPRLAGGAASRASSASSSPAYSSASSPGSSPGSLPVSSPAPSPTTASRAG